MAFGDGSIDNLRPRVETVAISRQESTRILGTTEIRGSEFRGFKLTPEVLTAHGLEPKYKYQIQEKEFVLSQPFMSDPEEHIAFIAYAKEGEKYITRNFYRSNSQGIWRNNAYFIVRRTGDLHYGKGYDEQSLNLATPLQEISETIATSVDPIPNFPEAEAIALGTTYELDLNGEKYGHIYKANKAQNPTAKEKYARIARDLQPHLDYEKQVKAAPIKLEGTFYDPYDEPVFPYPTSLHFDNAQQAPNYEQRVLRRNVKTSLYGDISIDVFPSQDGNITYSFCRDSLGRAWVGMIEVNGEVQSTGLRQQWVDGGLLMVPAYEYDNQEGDYGNPDLRNGDYVDMYKNYLSKIGTIQEYQAAVKA